MMLYHRVIFVLFISLIVSVSAYANEPSPVVNLVDNGGFESGLIAPWVTWGGGVS